MGCGSSSPVHPAPLQQQQKQQQSNAQQPLPQTSVQAHTGKKNAQQPRPSSPAYAAPDSPAPLELPPAVRPSFPELRERQDRASRALLTYDCFLSHKRSDAAEFARGLKEHLSLKYGLRCFLDEDSEENLGDSLLDSVRESACIVFVMSSNIFDSAWCARELRHAVLWEIPAVLITLDGSLWDGHEYPGERTLNRYPPETMTVFEHTKAIQHRRAYYAAFMEKLVARIEAATGKKITGGQKASAPNTQTVQVNAVQPAASTTATAQQQRAAAEHTQPADSQPAPASSASRAPGPLADRSLVAHVSQSPADVPRAPASPQPTSPSSKPGVAVSPIAAEPRSTPGRALSDHPSPLASPPRPPPAIKRESSILFASPDDSPLIQLKLKDPLAVLSAEQSIELLTQCVAYGRVQAQRAAGKDILIFIGNTGAGKSTTANFLAGCTMAMKHPRELGITGVEKVVVVEPPSDGGRLAEVMPIGHTKVSKTFMPQIETPPVNSLAAGAGIGGESGSPSSVTLSLTYCDCPGFLDNRGAEINIANACNIRAAIKAAKSVRVLILINYHSLKADRGRGLREMIKISSDLFGSVDSLCAHTPSLLIAVTSASLDMDLQSLREWIVDDVSPVMKALATRICVFDPLERQSDESAGWLSRQQMIAQIAALKPITAHAKIFATVLTDEDETTLLRLSASLGERIGSSLQRSQYPAAASALRRLQELAVIDHVVVERLIHSNRLLVARHFDGLAQAAKMHCSFERFDEAEAAIKALEEGGDHFDAEALADGMAAAEDLWRFLGDCRAKYERTVAREAELQRQLAAAETRTSEVVRLLAEQRAEMERRMAEQQEQHAALIAQLQSRIAETGASFDRMKGELTAELELRLKKKNEELRAAVGQNQAELSQKMAEEKARLQAEYDAKLREAAEARDAAIKSQQAERRKAEDERKVKDEEMRRAMAKMQEEQKKQEAELRAAAEQRIKADAESKRKAEEQKNSLGNAKGRLNIQFGKRAAISAEQVKSGGSPSAPPNAVLDKDHAAVFMIANVMKDNVVFVNLDFEHKAQIIAEMWHSKIMSGVAAIRQGDPGDCVYVVASGEFDVYVNDKKVAVRGKGTMFGELALMYNSPRAATVVANQDSAVWMIDRFTFRRIVTGLSVQKFDAYVRFLKNVQLLAPLDDHDRRKIAEALEEVSFIAGQTVFRQGDAGDAMYLVYKGEVKILKDNVEVMRCKVTDYFGERALLTAEPRGSSAVTASAVQLLKLDRNAFSLLLGPLEDIMKANALRYQQKGATGAAAGVRDGSDEPSAEEVRRRQEKALARAQAMPQIQFSNLRVLGTLGKGSFGFVQLVQDRTTDQTYALKAVSKAQIVQTGQQGHVMSEKKAMTLFDHPFLIKLYATYKDKNRLYFLLEPSLGGELFSVLRERTLFDEDTARFYAASVLIAFEYMHSLNMIYRDLKPENLLLDREGFLKVTDFGFAKDITSSRAWTLCGTPDYLAPEIVAGQGHGKGVDWWTLGIFIYEMLASFPPFYDDDHMKTYAKIMHGAVNYPSHFSKEAVSLIKKLLQHKATKRLGVVKGGAAEIKKHPWFRGFDFDALVARKVKPPIVPKIKSHKDLSNFDDNWSSEVGEVEPYVDDGSKWDELF